MTIKQPEIIKRTESHDGNIVLNERFKQISKVNQDNSMSDADVLQLLNLSDEEFNKEITNRCNTIIKQIEDFKNSIQ